MIHYLIISSVSEAGSTIFGIRVYGFLLIQCMKLEMEMKCFTKTKMKNQCIIEERSPCRREIGFESRF